jgi:hypothetical protein
LGLWFRDGDTASWSRVLQSGDEVDGRIVSALNGASLGILFQPGAGASGHSQSINDDGLFALELRFTDGSKGIYRVTVPEPGGMTATALFALCAASLRRRRAVGP